MPHILRRSWPRGTVDLLLRAALAPADQARRAWQAFVDYRQFDEVTWHEMRLLAILSGRLREIDPPSPYRPRVDGIAKNLWTQTQMVLREGANAFDILTEDGIPFIIIKGGTQYVEGVRDRSRRIMGDIDILVQRNRAVTAIEALTRGGWVAANGESPALLLSTASVRLSTNFRRGERGDVDLHVDPFHYSRTDGAAADALWRRAQPQQLVHRQVLVPDPTDSALIALVHGALGEGGDWAIDMAAHMTRGGLDWEQLADRSVRQGLVPATWAGLLYLRDALSLRVPDRVITTLSRASVPTAEWLKFWSNVRDRRDRNLVEKAANRLANRLLEGRGYSMVVSDRRAIVVTRPAMPWQGLLGRGRLLDSYVGEEAHLQELTIHGPVVGRQVIVKIALKRPTKSRRVYFDVTANGIAIARLRGRTGGWRVGRERIMAFRIPLRQPISGDTRIQIEARPIGYLAPTSEASQRDAIEPIRFRVTAAWIC